MSDELTKKTVEDGDVPESAHAYLVEKKATGEYTISIGSRALVDRLIDEQNELLGIVPEKA